MTLPGNRRQEKVIVDFFSCCSGSHEQLSLVARFSYVMYHFSGLNRFLVKSLASLSIFNTCIQCCSLHSFHRSSEPKRPTPRRKTKNSRKSLRKSSSSSWVKKDVTVVEAEKDRKQVYMRDVVFKIYGILRYSPWETAKQELTNLGIKWDSLTVNRVLKTHPPMEKAWIFFNWVSNAKGFKHDHFTYTTMLDIFGEAGRIESMNYVFKEMQEKGMKMDAVTYTSVMHWASRAGDVDRAIKIWEEIKEKRLHPTVVSYTAFMKVLFDNKRVKEASDAYKEMLDSGISPNCHTYTVLMEHLVAAGKHQEALQIFADMQEAGERPDKAACNILVQRLCQVGETKAITHILQYMKEHHLVLRYPVFLDALRTFQNAGKSGALLRLINSHFAAESMGNGDVCETMTTADNDLLYQGLVMILLQKQNLIAVDRFLAGIMEKNIVLESWILSIIIEINCDRCRPDGALLAFQYGRNMGIDLERAAYLALIGIFLRSNTFPKVVEIIEGMIKAGHSLGIYLASILIYRLGCARRPTCAAKIFDLLPYDHKCTATYTALVSVYFSAGAADKGLKVFKTMKKRQILSSLGTYNVILSGLERSGKVSGIETYRKEKKSLLIGGYYQNILPLEAKICDLLFAGDIVS